ncbi:MAG: HAD family phosphatase [Actinomycetales bacterium]|nr:HAD family phosphatase [Actinomycetales bacterium]
MPAPADRRPAALLWDMDGTLIDSEPYWLRAEIELVESFGGVWSWEDGLQLVGSSLDRSAVILQSRGVRLEGREIIERMTDRVAQQLDAAIPWRPGARELLLEAREAGVPSALVTMSIGRMARHIAGGLGEGTFATIVAGDDVVNGKPHPEPYLTACARLGVAPADCVAIEDSEPGVASAVASGAATIAVPLHIPLPPSPAYALWEGGLDGRSLDDLAAVHADRTAGGPAPTERAAR